LNRYLNLFIGICTFNNNKPYLSEKSPLFDSGILCAFLIERRWKRVTRFH
jgi:hypothetical protein